MSSLHAYILVQGRLAEARAELQTVVKLSPEHPQAHYELGSIHEQLGESREAVREFQIALKLDPTSSLIKQKLINELN